MIAPRRWLGVAPNTLAQLPLALCLAAVDRRPPPEGTPRGRRCVLATVRGLEAPLPVRRGTTACLRRSGTVAAYEVRNLSWYRPSEPTTARQRGIGRHSCGSGRYAGGMAYGASGRGRHLPARTRRGGGRPAGARYSQLSAGTNPVQGQARFAEANALCPLVVQEHVQYLRVQRTGGAAEGSTTRERQRCSHCIIHQRTVASRPARTAVQRNSASSSPGGGDICSPLCLCLSLCLALSLLSTGYRHAPYRYVREVRWFTYASSPPAPLHRSPG